MGALTQGNFVQRVIVTLAQIIRRASFLHPFVLRLVAQAGRSDSWVLFGPAGFANQPRAHTCLGGGLRERPGTSWLTIAI